MAKYCPYCVSRIESGDTCPYCNFSYTYKIKPHHLRPGTLLNNKYLIGRVLGEGGFGITYLGRDLTLDMKVAIKEYYPAGSASRISNQSTAVSLEDWTRSRDYDKGRAQFIHEAQTIAKMDKESAVVTVRDFFEMNNSAYIVMEFIEGQDMRDIIAAENKPIDKKKLLPLLEPIFAALTEMHKIGLIHRDISPDNIMVENGRARLIDFGCTAKTVDLSSADKVLKHSFSPIEQYHNSNMGPWSDVYAMAATIYYCLTGKLPPNALDRAQMDTLAAPSVLGTKLLPKQEKALMKALSVEQNDRFQSIEEFGKAFFVHTNLYKYIAIAACTVAVLAAAAFILFKPEAKVETLKVKNQPTTYLTARDSLSAKEEELLQKVCELAASASFKRGDIYDFLSITNTTGESFEALWISCRYFNDEGIIVGYSNGRAENLDSGMSFECSLYPKIKASSRAEVLITYLYNDNHYNTEYIQLSSDNVENGPVNAAIEVVNSLPHRFKSKSFAGDTTYSVSEVTCMANNAMLDIIIKGAVIDRQDESQVYISYRVTNDSGAVVATENVSLGILRKGDVFEIRNVCVLDTSAGQTYYIEFADYTY